MLANSPENKALLWDVLLEAGFFTALEETHYPAVKASLDGYVSDPSLADVPVLEANKSIIESMHLYINKILETRTGDAKALDGTLHAKPLYQRSSTI